ncbi:MAG: ABC transporter ATP-binding protein [Betaproteobacteria bacterium]
MKVLDVKNLEAGYGRIKVLHGISLSVEEGTISVLLGANGAGKTTTLRAISGLLKGQGNILLDGKEINGMRADVIARAGVAHAAEGRGTFTDLTVEDNLRVGAFRRQDKKEIELDMERMYDLFPRLLERRAQKAGSLSGGEQQMLAVGRALMLRPRVLLLDEPSLGLAPVIINGLFATLSRVNKEFGTTMLIVEQNANLALEIAHYAYVLESGKISLEGPAHEIAAHDGVRAAYLGD